MPRQWRHDKRGPCWDSRFDFVAAATVPDQALTLLHTLRDDEAGGRSALQGHMPDWHVVPPTSRKLETPPKVEPRRKAVIENKPKKSLWMPVGKFQNKK